MFHFPEPGVRYTRATLTLRRPTACQRSSGVTEALIAPPPRRAAPAAGPRGVASREPHLRGVHHHDTIAAVQVRRERRLVLAPQELRHAAREPAEGLARGVHHPPAPRHVLLAQYEGLHANPVCVSLIGYQRHNGKSTRGFRG